MYKIRCLVKKYNFKYCKLLILNHCLIHLNLYFYFYFFQTLLLTLSNYLTYYRYVFLSFISKFAKHQHFNHFKCSQKKRLLQWHLQQKENVWHKRLSFYRQRFRKKRPLKYFGIKINMFIDHLKSKCCILICLLSFHNLILVH